MAAEEGVCVGIRADGEPLPLIVRPRDGEDSVLFLKTWVRQNKSWLDSKLLEHGAILFRGFRVEEGIEFQEVVQEYNPELSDQYRGTSPRRLVPGTQFVFTASELPPGYPIPQHLEMSFLPAPPRKLFFCCLEAPTSLGGETRLCDYKKVYEQMDPTIRKDFEEKGIMHIRNYHRDKGFISDPTMMKGWEAVFGTEDKRVVEEELRSDGLDFSWKKNDGLQIVHRTASVEKHPETGEKIWFNHLQVFHWSMFSDEYYRTYQRLGLLKHLLYSWFMWLLEFFFLNIMGPNRVGFHTCFGDGSTIPHGHNKHSRDVVWRNMVFNRWEKGDVLMIDNFRVSHGRQPYTGKRKIVVAWSKPQKRPSMAES